MARDGLRVGIGFRSYSRIPECHLNVGIGEAWALQARANAESESAKIFSVASEENLGADPPTGSKSVIFNR